jgi:hypothetical protein
LFWQHAGQLAGFLRGYDLRFARDRSPHPLSNGHASRAEHAFNPRYYFVVLQKVATASRSSAFFNRLGEAGLILQHTIDGVFDYLGCVASSASSDLLQPGLDLGREMYFHMPKAMALDRECQSAAATPS